MLSEFTKINVRFHEVDSLRIVWHGHYLKYFEDGREAFGRKYGIGYMDVFSVGLMTPLVKISCEYKRPVKYDDNVMLETRFVNTEAAKVIFEFILFNETTKEVYATGESTQIFLNEKNELMLTSPEFFMDWKKKWGLLT
ncbi:MAG TPA: acyl-CoA thioesterase [Bacteroidales bacterium]|nr:acyl-CoA thioesterase [Bacteroidales bacterium]